MTTVHRTTIRLASGRYFDFENLDSNTLSIEDIAHGLSHICRFCGHTDVFYSVAQHSVLASYLDKDNPLPTLLHDAAESVLGDVSSPLKRMLPDYKAIELRVEEWLFAQLGVQFPLPFSVKQADLTMLAWEQRDVMNAGADVWAPTRYMTAPPTRIIPWTTHEARLAFINRYREVA